MRRMMLLTGLLVGLLGASYPVTPEAGVWLILVQSYTGETSASMAEELTTSLRRDYRINAYTFNRGEEERVKERTRIEQLRRKTAEAMRVAGAAADTPVPPIKTYRIEDQYAVLIGGWKDQETARKALDQVRKLKPPSEKLSHKAVLVESREDNKGEVKYAAVNPFTTAFVVRNPMVPAEADPEQGKLQNLKEYNEKESLSLLKCKKPWTLMVKTYHGAVSVSTADAAETKSFLAKVTGNNKPGELLTASGKQAHAVAEALKVMEVRKGEKVIQTDVYVLHTEQSSYICVGGYNKPDDPQLLVYQKKLANMKLFPYDTLNAQPLPMQVPKP